MADETKSVPGQGPKALPNPLAYFHSMPARYRIFILITLLSGLLLAAGAALLGYNQSVFSNLVFFTANIFIIMLMAGLTFLLCIWTAMAPTRNRLEWTRFILLALLSYTVSAFLIGFFLYLSLTALAGTLTNSDLLIFASLAMSIGIIFLARVFSAMDWKRAEDLLFSIVIYSIVIGTLFFQAGGNVLPIIPHVIYVYTASFSWAFAYSIGLALGMELLMRSLYARWHHAE